MFMRVQLKCAHQLRPPPGADFGERQGTTGRSCCESCWNTSGSATPVVSHFSADVGVDVRSIL
jgi:hypothetical protein